MVGLGRTVSAGLLGAVLVVAPLVPTEAAQPRRVEVVTDPRDDQSPKPDIPKSRLDVREVRYTQGPNSALRVTIHAVDVRDHRATLREFYAIDISTSDAEVTPTFRVRPRSKGLLVTDLSTGRTTRTRGDFTVLADRDDVRFAIPSRALGRPDAVALSVLVGLISKEHGNFVQTDSTSEGRPIQMTY